MNCWASTDGKRTPNSVAVFRSADSGKTWKSAGTFPKHLPGTLKPYPFGSIVAATDKTLRTLAYTLDEKQTESAWMMTSRDDGRSWAGARKVADGINESVLLPLAGQSWFCLDRVPYHVCTLTILLDKTGKLYGQGAGLRVLADGKEVAAADILKKVTEKLR